MMTQTTAFTEALEEIALERETTLEEACQEAVRQDPSSRQPLTPRILERGGFAGCGTLLDSVLHFTEEERERIARAWAQAVLG